MRQSKSEFFGSREDEKPVIVLDYRVPSAKRFREMTDKDRADAVEWLKERISLLNYIIKTELKP